MNPKAMNLKWVAAFVVAAAVVGAIGVIVALTAMAGGGDEQVTARSANPTASPAGATPIDSSPTPPLSTATPQTGVYPTTDSSVTELPYRLVMTGPKDARPGEEVTYRVDFACLSPGATQCPISMVLTWTPGAVTLVSVGPPEFEFRVAAGQVRWDIRAPQPTGTVEVVFSILEDFTGELVVGVDIPGSSIRLPPGSVTSVHTSVTH